MEREHIIVEAETSPLPLIWWKDVELDCASTDLIEDVLPDGGLSVIYGEAHCGKSFFVADMAFHVALGWEWRGLRTTQGGVIYIAGEGGRGMERRILAFNTHHDLGAMDVPFQMLPCAIDLLDPEADVDALIAAIHLHRQERGAPVRLVVIDTLSRALAGGDENSPTDMGALVHNVDRIRRETEAHVVLIHHAGKDYARGPRGHSLLIAAVDTAIHIRRHNPTAPSVARLVKQRDGESRAEFSFGLRKVRLGQSLSGEPITSCVVMTAAGLPEKAVRRLSPQHRNVLAALGQALANEGTDPPAGSEYPRTGKVVRLDIWRRYSDASRVADTDKPDTLRKAFERGAASLQATGIIGIWEGYAWRCD